MAKTITIACTCNFSGLLDITRSTKAKNMLRKYAEAERGNRLMLCINSDSICNYSRWEKRIPDIKEVYNRIMFYGDNLLEDSKDEAYADKEFTSEEINAVCSITVKASVTFNQLYAMLDADTQAILNPFIKAKLKDDFMDMLRCIIPTNMTIDRMHEFLTIRKNKLYKYFELKV